MNPKLISSAIRAGRNALGLSRKEFAAMCNLAVPTIARLETEKCHSTFFVIVSIFNVFEQQGITFSWNDKTHYEMKFVLTDPERVK